MFFFCYLLKNAPSNRMQGMATSVAPMPYMMGSPAPAPMAAYGGYPTGAV